MSTQPDSNDDAKLDDLLAELEKETSEESNDSKSEKIKTKQSAETLAKLKYDNVEITTDDGDDLDW